jgi:hypothetical protein
VRQGPGGCGRPKGGCFRKKPCACCSLEFYYSLEVCGRQYQTGGGERERGLQLQHSLCGGVGVELRES